MNRFYRFFCICLAFLAAFQAQAQKPLNPVAPTGPQSIVEVINADIQEGVNLKNMQLQTFTGNVIFKHNGVIMGTDKAIQNTTNNTMEAYGNIKFNQGDTLTIVGDSLFYEGNSRMATIWGKNVILRDKKTTLRTQKIIYNLASGMAYYPVLGVIKDDSSQLSSKTGYYNTNTKYFNYIGDVQILNPQFVLCTEKMDYDTHTKKAIFLAPTEVTSKDGTLKASKGWYNIQTKESSFVGRSKVDNEEYSLEGDTLFFDSAKKFGWSKGNVVFISKTDSVIAVGDEGIRVGEEGITKLNGNTIAKYFTARDTAYLASDSLRIIEKPKKVDSEEAPSKENVQWIIAHGNVNVYRKDMQSISDSLVYNLVDSMITYYQEPVVWYVKNQVKADTIRAFLKNDRVSKVDLKKNCFIIQQDTLNNFNQIKGRNISTYFTDSSQIEKIHIFGNAESKFFVLDEENKIIGLEVSQCSQMDFYFLAGELETIKYYTDVDAKLIPPFEISLSDARFEDFDYRGDEKPSKEKMRERKLGKLLEETKWE